MLQAPPLPHQQRPLLSRRAVALQEGLRRAVGVPLALAETVASLWPALQELALCGNLACRSDLQVPGAPGSGGWAGSSAASAYPSTPRCCPGTLCTPAESQGARSGSAPPPKHCWGSSESTKGVRAVCSPRLGLERPEGDRPWALGRWQPRPWRRACLGHTSTCSPT